MNETGKIPEEIQSPQTRYTLSLRNKIILGNIIIVLVAVAAMGFFLFFRSQAANEFLIDQFDASVKREIENELTSVVAREVDDISIFFYSMKNVVDIFGTTTGAFTSNDKKISLEENEWNAYQALFQLPNGNWDNADSETSSIFLPADTNINNNLAKELAALKDLDFFAAGLLEENPEIVAIYFGGKSKETVYYPNIDLSALLPPDFDVTGRPWYVNASGFSEEDKKSVWSVPYQDAALNGLVITSSVPVFDEAGTFRGVSAIDLQLATITDRISKLNIRKSGYGFLIDSEGRVIAIPEKGYADFNLTEAEIQSDDIENRLLTTRVSLDVFSVLAKMITGQTDIRLVEINGSNRYIAFQPIPIVGYSFGVVVSESEMLAEFVRTKETLETESAETLLEAVGIILIILSVSALASYGIGNTISAPIEKLTQVAQEVTSGNLAARADINTRDETGLLANTLNNMTSTSQDLITNLEEIVAERTQAIEKRAAQIQAAAEVGQAVAAQRNLEQLLFRATHLVSSRFNYYHAAIYLIDPRKEYAIMRAANSTGGTQMIARNHKLQVGKEGIVGTVAGSGEARIALDVGEDAVYFDSPELSQTHSEMALPLIAVGEILGVLDLQSVDTNAFTQDDIPTLQVLADQLATAVQNARLLRETQEALIAARKATRDISEEGWDSFLKEVEATGYISLTQGELIHASDDLDESMKSRLVKGEIVLDSEKQIIRVPITTRGHTIGMMRLVKPSHADPWTAEEIASIESMASQIGNTLDGARLFEQIQKRAAYDRIVGEASTRIRETLDIETVLESAALEMRNALNLAEAEVWVSPEPNSNLDRESIGDN